MQYRTFGRTGWKVSEIGYGMWGMAGWTGSEEKEVNEEKLNNNNFDYDYNNKSFDGENDESKEASFISEFSCNFNEKQNNQPKVSENCLFNASSTDYESIASSDNNPSKNIEIFYNFIRIIRKYT